MTAKTKLSSIIQTVLLLGVEMGLDMASQNIDINIAWIQDEIWQEKREVIWRSALKQIERLSCVRVAECEEERSSTTSSFTECAENLNLIPKKT